ncbi:unnamed protein product [Sphagnum troendelagicum]|uniref:Uncharacterized protein n=1 Tax=Sphagnum troendelagicum TaxID=128251 RepID=A0ABP0TUT3_9BRYO
MAAAMLSNQFREEKKIDTLLRVDAILRRCRNCNPAGAVTTNRNWSKHSKTRRWLDFCKYILSWHASIVGYVA